MTRREFSRRTKLDAWDRCQKATGRPVCECGCGLPILASDPAEYDHRIPCEEGGDNSLENCVVMRRSCHQTKTAEDAARFAKGRKARARHANARTVRHVIPGSKASGWKKPINGPAVRRGDD